MAIKLGEKILRDIYLGDKRIVKAYFGNKLVFEADKPIFVDYIESTGTQYISTEYIMTSDNQEVECEFQYTDSTSTQCLCGTLPGANRGITPYTNNDSNFYVYTGQPAVLKFTNFDYSAKHSLYVKAVVGQGVYGKLDNTEQTTTTVLTTINKSNAYFLFCRNNGVNNKPDTSYFKGRIYRFKMKDDGVVVRDLKPCLHPKTFEACMYDLVTHKYFYNKGTGSFIPAPRFVEYLEFDGASYIDTGLFPNSNWRIESVWLATVGSKNIYSSNVEAKRIFGRTAGGTWWFGGSTVGSNNTKLPLNTVNTTVHDKNGIIFNGVSYAYDKEVDEFDTSVHSLYLGTLKNNLSTSFEGRIYDFKIYDNNTLIQHLRPCLDYNNVACMYDMVTGKYFYNQGTGEFKYGGLV